jgi:hypothetical protein
MEIQTIVNNCGNCPFMVTEINHDSPGTEIMISCNLIPFLKLEQLSHNRFRTFDYNTWLDLNYLEPLEHCPLKNTDKIEIKYGS